MERIGVFKPGNVLTGASESVLCCFLMVLLGEETWDGDFMDNSLRLGRPNAEA